MLYQRMTLELVTQRIRIRFKAYSVIPFSKNSYHIDTIQLICLADHLIGFYIRVFTERYFGTDCNSILKIMKRQQFYSV